MNQYDRALFIYDTIAMLRWILGLDGDPSYASDAPMDSNLSHEMTHHPTGKLYDARPISDSQFIFTVTEAGMKFLSVHGWKDTMEVSPTEMLLTKETSASVKSDKKKNTLTSVWLLDRNRKVHQFKDLSKVKPHILKILRDNRFAIINGQLFAISPEDLMGSEIDPSLSVH